MKKLPKADVDKSLLLRTDFSDDAAWNALCEAVQVPNEEGFFADLQFHNDVAFDGLTVDQLLALKPKDSGYRFLFIADNRCLTTPEKPILVVDLKREPGRTFRVIPSEIWGVENNLSIANMSFHEFANSTDQDGIFRGFR